MENNPTPNHFWRGDSDGADRRNVHMGIYKLIPVLRHDLPYHAAPGCDSLEFSARKCYLRGMSCWARGIHRSIHAQVTGIA